MNQPTARRWLQDAWRFGLVLLAVTSFGQNGYAAEHIGRVLDPLELEYTEIPAPDAAGGSMPRSERVESAEFQEVVPRKPAPVRIDPRNHYEQLTEGQYDNLDPMVEIYPGGADDNAVNIPSVNTGEGAHPAIIPASEEAIGAGLSTQAEEDRIFDTLNRRRP